MEKKRVHVVAAIIYKEESEEPGGIPTRSIFATQRGYGPLAGGWEFPGGKVEPGETLEEALIREIREELDTRIIVEQFFDRVEYEYETFYLEMDCFLCTVAAGDLVLKEHADSAWLTAENLESVDWLPADISLIEKIRRSMF